MADYEADFDPSAFEFDLSPKDEVASVVPFKTAVLRTSDRIMFRRCRRRWGWNSHLKMNLGPKTNAGPLWLGSGFHYALEDLHGEKIYGSAVRAFQAYSFATREYKREQVPGDWRELQELAKGMLEYYEDTWLLYRDPFKTFIFNDIPQVEVNFRVDVPFDAQHFGYEKVVYSGTLDRVIVDEYGQLWIVEYKTAKQIQTMHFAIDPQVSNYCWAGQRLYGQPIAGVIYIQFRKDIPKLPKVLSSGKLSVDTKQLTTHALYRAALKNIYGADFTVWPVANLDFLNELARRETSESDAFVRRDRVYRNEFNGQVEGTKILLEAEEMLNPDLALYPNPTRDCPHMCPFYQPCNAMDDGGDYEYELSMLMGQRDPQYDTWRNCLPDPNSGAKH